MGNWGFRKTFGLGRGARVTVGKKSVGFSIGAGPIRLGVNSKTGARGRVTLPGTGLYYEQRASQKRPRVLVHRHMPRALVTLAVLAAVIAAFLIR